jgi:hypothetical protein
MPSRRFPAKRGILLKRIHKMRHAVAITDRKPAPKMGSIPTLATLMATAFRPHNRQRAVNSEADFTSSFSFAEKASMEELSLTPNAGCKRGAWYAIQDTEVNEKESSLHDAA